MRARMTLICAVSIAIFAILSTCDAAPVAKADADPWFIPAVALSAVSYFVSDLLVGHDWPWVLKAKEAFNINNAKPAPAPAPLPAPAPAPLPAPAPAPVPAPAPEVKAV